MWRIIACSCVSIGCLWAATDAAAQQRAQERPPQGRQRLADDTKAPDRFYYGLNGQRIPLTQSDDKFVVVFREDADSETQELAVQSQPDIVGRAKRSGGARANRIRMVDVIAGSGKGRAARDSIRRLRTEAAVEHVAPVLRGESGEEELLTQYLYFSMATPINDERVAALLETNGLELVKRIDYPELGKVGFRARVSEENTRDALDIANSLFERQEVLEAAPVFAHMYQVLTGSPVDKIYEPSTSTLSDDLPQWNWHAVSAYGGDWGDANQAYIDIEDAWETLYQDPPEGVELNDVVLAILDTGVQLSYVGASGSTYIKRSNEVAADVLAEFPELSGKSWSGPGGIHGWDFVGSDLDEITNPAYGGDSVPFPDYLEPADVYWDDDYPNHDGIAEARGHGTAVATLAAGRGDELDGMSNPMDGIAGACWECEVMALRVHLGGYRAPASGGDFLYDWRVSEAIRWAADNGARVIGGSMGSRVYSPDMHDAVRYARSKGAVVVAPCGNGDVSLDIFPLYPACFPEVIAVGAVRADKKRCQDGDFQQYSGELAETGFRTGGSNYGTAMDVMAPSSSMGYSYFGNGTTDIAFVPAGNVSNGKSVAGTDLDTYAGAGGTSIAWPQVAGVVGMLLQYHTDTAWWLDGDKRVSAEEVHAVLAFTAEDISSGTDPEASAGRDSFTGWGIPDASAALVLLTDSTKRTKLMHVDTGLYVEEVAWIDFGGNLFAKSRIVTGLTASSWMLTPEMGDYTLSSGGGVKMRIDKDGFIYLAGNLMENSNLGIVSGTAIQVNGTTVAKLDSSGNLHIDGVDFEGANPDPDYKARPYEIHVPFFKDVNVSWLPSTTNEATLIGLQNTMPMQAGLELQYFKRDGTRLIKGGSAAILGRLGDGADSLDSTVSFRPYASDSYLTQFKIADADVRSLRVLSPTPLTGRVVVGHNDDVASFGLHSGVQLLDSDSASLEGTLRGGLGAKHLCVPFLVDNATDNVFPVTSGYAQLIAVQNLSGYPTNVEVTYYVYGSSTPANTWTLSLKPFETVRWRPWKSLSGVEDYGTTSITKASSAIHSVEMSVIEEDDSSSSEATPGGSILGYSLTYTPDGMFMYELPAFNPSTTDFEPIYIPYVNDSGKGALLPGGGNKSAYIGLHNPTSQSVSLNIKYRDSSGTQRTQNTETLTIPAHQTASWNPFWHGLTPPSEPVVTGVGQHEFSVEITRTSMNGNVVGRLVSADSTGLYATALETGTGHQQLLIPYMVDNGTTNTYINLRNTTTSTVNYLVQYFDGDGELTSSDTDSIPARGYDRWRPNKSPASDARQAIISVTSASGRIGGSLVTEDPTTPYSITPMHPTIVLADDFSASDGLYGWSSSSVFTEQNGILQRAPGTTLSSTASLVRGNAVADFRLRFSYMYTDQSSDTGIVRIRNHSNAVNFAYLEFGPSSYALKEYVAGTVTRGTETATADPNTWYDVYVEAKGSTVKVWRVESGAIVDWDNDTPDITSSSIFTTSTINFAVSLEANSDYRYDNFLMRAYN